jgi:hypothetical protein
MSTLSCEQCEDLLPGYLLDALGPEEAASVAEHLHTCVQCQASQSAYEMVLERLAEAIAWQTPPSTVQPRLMSAIGADLTSAASREMEQRRRRRGLPWVAVWAVANVILCLGLGWWGWTAWQVVARVRANEQALVQQIDIQKQALALLTAPDSQRAILSGEGSQSRGVLLLRATAPEAVLIVLDLPVLKPDRAYQLWLGREGGRDNGGVFQVDARGFGILHIQAPMPFASYQRVGITEEPASGSPGPTTARVIGGKL